MIQLRKSCVVVDHADVERLKVEFREKHCVLLPRLLEPALLDLLRERIEPGIWRDKEHKGIGVELVLDDLPALNLLRLLVNQPCFLQTIMQITGCEDITWFEGRVYRFVPQAGHFDSWHSDNVDGRVVALSLNLSVRIYQGGVFQLRDRETKRVLTEVANIGWGDATLFRISDRLDHQVTEVIGSEAKTAYAGWFQRGQPDLLTRLRTDLAEAAQG